MSQANDLSETEGYDGTKPNSRLWLMKLMIKAATINEIARSNNAAEIGKDYICDAFFRAGEVEKVSGMIFNGNQKKREFLNKEKSKKGFYMNICISLFKLLGEYVPRLKSFVDQTEANANQWKAK